MKVSHININTSSWKTKVNSLSSLLSPLVLQGNSLRLSSSSQLLQARWKELLCLSCCFCSHRSQTCQMWCRFLSPRDQDQQRDIMSVFSSSHSQSGCPECVCSPVCSDVMWRQQLDSVSSNSSQTSRSCCSCFKNTLLTVWVAQSSFSCWNMSFLMSTCSRGVINFQQSCTNFPSALDWD